MLLSLLLFFILFIVFMIFKLYSGSNLVSVIYIETHQHIVRICDERGHSWQYIDRLLENNCPWPRRYDRTCANSNWWDTKAPSISIYYKPIHFFLNFRYIYITVSVFKIAVNNMMSYFVFNFQNQVLIITTHISALSV